MPYEALIFDCDGTLTHSMPAHYAAWQLALAECALEFPEERFYGLAGVPGSKIIALLAAETGRLVDAAAILQRKETEFLRSIHLIQEIAAVTAVVRQRRGQVKMAVASGGMRHVILAQLAQIGLSDYFEAVVCAEDTERHKPEPDVFLEAARRLG